MKRILNYLLIIVLLFSLVGCNNQDNFQQTDISNTPVVEIPAENPILDPVTPSTPLDDPDDDPEPDPDPDPDPDGIPAYSGSPYVVLNNNVPSFEESDLTTTSFESYSALDSLGRCGAAYANVGRDIMPTESRGSISSVKPTGWHSVSYNCVDGGSLYNRCHLIGFQLTGENANKQNLITGTRYMNADGMLPFEEMIADYIKETNNHVLYRVTPIFTGNNLIADGVQMEAMSVEDDGEGICFNVYCYNVQPGIYIDYLTGDSHLIGEDTTPPISADTTYVLNTSSMKFHYPTCSSVGQMSEANKQESTATREELIALGYSPCGSCKP